MKKIFLLIFLLALFVQPALSSDVQEVDQLLRENVDKVLKIVRIRDLSKEDKKEQVMEVVNRIFNLPLMAKLTLGQTHWTNLNEKQRAEFTDLFIKQMQGIISTSWNWQSTQRLRLRSRSRKKKKFIC